MEFKIETSNYNILTSGSLIIPTNEDVIFKLDNLNFRFTLKEEERVTDKPEGRFEIAVTKNEKEEAVLVVKLFNMNSAFFATPNKILKVGHYGGYVLYLSFSLVSLKSPESVQQLLFYTFYQDKNKKE